MQAVERSGAEGQAHENRRLLASLSLLLQLLLCRACRAIWMLLDVRRWVVENRQAEERTSLFRLGELKNVAWAEFLSSYGPSAAAKSESSPGSKS